MNSYISAPKNPLYFSLIAPLSTDPHLAHICTNGSFRNDFTSFSKFYSDFRCTIVLLGIIINILYFCFYNFTTFFCIRRYVGEAMRDIPSERHLKISRFRRRKPDVQPFWQLPSFQTLRDKWLPSFFQNVDCFF